MLFMRAKSKMYNPMGRDHIKDLTEIGLLEYGATDIDGMGKANALFQMENILKESGTTEKKL
jgi:hypothetical protein